MRSGNDGAVLAAGLLVVLAIIVIVCAAIPAWRRRDRFTLAQTREIRSEVDGQRYRVHLSHFGADRAADTLAALNARVVDLLRALRHKYLRGSAGLRSPDRAAAVRRLLARYNPDHLAENSPRDPVGDTSYTIDKGAVLALCLREKDAGRRGDPAVHDFHDLDTLAFVTFHELTHIAIEEYDHPTAFWAAFKFILADAVEAGLLRGVDYGRHPTVYCGMTIDYNPLYDKGLPAVI